MPHDALLVSIVVVGMLARAVPRADGVAYDRYRRPIGRAVRSAGLGRQIEAVPTHTGRMGCPIATARVWLAGPSAAYRI